MCEMDNEIEPLFRLLFLYRVVQEMLTRA